MQDNTEPAELQISYLDSLVLLLALKQQRGTFSNENRIVKPLFVKSLSEDNKTTSWAEWEKQSTVAPYIFLILLCFSYGLILTR